VVPVSPLTNSRTRSLAHSDRRIPAARTAPLSTFAASRPPVAQPKSITAMNLAATSVYTTAALISTLSGGLFSGGLHAIAGTSLDYAIVYQCSLVNSPISAVSRI
jgi:hypothetical protein